MTIKHFTAALQGQGGIYKALRSTWGTRFSIIRAFVMIPSRSEKLELKVQHNALNDCDLVTLTRRNWRTGEECTLYAGDIAGGKPKKKRLPKD